MSSKKSLVVAAVAALGLCFAQGASALHGSVSGGIKFKLSGTFECSIDPGELTSLFHNEAGSPYIEFRTVNLGGDSGEEKTITCTKNDGVSPAATGEFKGSFKTTGPLQISCAMPPATPAGTSKQTIASSCPSGDLFGTLTAVSGDFAPGSAYNIGGALGSDFCAAVFPNTLPAGLAENVIMQSERFFNNDSCGANEFSSGDLFVGVAQGKVQWWKVSNPPETLTASNACGTAPGINDYTTGMAFDDANILYVTMHNRDQVCRFNKLGQQLPDTFPPYPYTYTSGPESIVFNNAGHAYVCKKRGDGDIHEIDANGTPLEVNKFDVAIQNVGADCLIDLACDQKTLLYTSAGGGRILAFDVSTGTQLDDFYTGPPLNGLAFTLRIIPSGPFAGQVLVANWVDVKRISADGSQILATYDKAGEDSWFALDLAENGTQFWAAGYNTSNVHKFDIAGDGAHVPVFTFNTGTPPLTVAGLRVKHGLNCGTQPLPSPTVLDGTMKMRPCGADNVGTLASCLHPDENNVLVPVVNDVNTLTQLGAIPIEAFPENIGIPKRKRTITGVWVRIDENESVPLAVIWPKRDLLRVENTVKPTQFFGKPVCFLKPGVRMTCRFNKGEVVDALIKNNFDNVRPTAKSTPVELDLTGEYETTDPTSHAHFTATVLVNLVNGWKDINYHDN